MSNHINDTSLKLQRIRARCIELLAIAEKRTPGEWKWDGKDLWHQGTGYEGSNPHLYTGINKDERLAQSPAFRANALFIAYCAGAAEAGWRSTIASIDHITLHGFIGGNIERAILSAWPDELL